jgi:hypothetical protein
VLSLEVSVELARAWSSTPACPHCIPFRIRIAIAVLNIRELQNIELLMKIGTN